MNDKGDEDIGEIQAKDCSSEWNRNATYFWTKANCSQNLDLLCDA